MEKTDWESSSRWYDDLVGCKGHYYHQHVVLPGTLKLLDLNKDSTLLDLACGQGILARATPKDIPYLGIDGSFSLIQSAKKLNRNKLHQFREGDITKALPIEEKFSHATIILALQNLARPDLALKEAAKSLSAGGTLVMVLNHPCFRIPRQSHWGIDESKKLQYRKIDRYLTALQIPIQTHPGKKESTTSLTFHHSLTDISRFLFEAGFTIQLMQEWISDKKSAGKNAKMENRAREEFPLFLALKCKSALAV